jgi:hypothetical protein
MPRNKKQKTATDNEVEFKETLVVHNPCCSLIYGGDQQCSNYASDSYTCPGSGYTFCRSHRMCIQPASITAYRAVEQVRARVRAKLVTDGKIPAPMVKRIFELAGKVPPPVGEQAAEWSSYYVHRICGPRGPPRRDLPT